MKEYEQQPVQPGIVQRVLGRLEPQAERVQVQPRTRARRC